MIARIAASLFIAGWLGACITTTTGSPAAERNEAEAARANLDLGISYIRQGNYQEAMVKLRRSIEAQPNNPTAHRLLGLVYEQLGDPVLAEKEYYIAVRQAPDDPDALNQLASFLCAQNKDRREALGYFDRALEVPLYPRRFLLYSNAGTCAKPVDLARAENYLRRGLELNPEYAETLLQLADVAFLRGNYLQSRAFVERYFAAADANSQALWIGYRVENALGDTATANGYADQLLRNFPESVETRLLLEQRRNAG
jgi:type IV pilus assembly protein PilF